MDEESEFSWSVTAYDEDDDSTVPTKRAPTAITVSDRGGPSTSGGRTPGPSAMITFQSSETTRKWQIHSSILTPQSETFANIHDYEWSDSPGSVDPCSWLPTLDRSGLNSYQLVCVSDKEFDSFIKGVQPKVLTPLETFTDISRLGQELTLEDLTRILVLASDWAFPGLRKHAIAAIPSFKPGLAPIPLILLARRANVPKWLLHPYVQLCTRLAPLDKTDASALGLESTSAVTAAREKVLRRRLGLVRSKTPPAWMGSNWWHSGCWALMTDAWNDALERRYFSVTPLQALMGALVDLKSRNDEDGSMFGRKLCASCDDEARILVWLDLDRDALVAENVLRETMGNNPEQWIYKR